MASKFLRATLCGLLLSGGAAAAQDVGQSGVTATAGPWALKVAALPSTGPTALWAGLTNGSDKARLVCVLSRGVSYGEATGAVKALIEGGSPHGCEVDEQFQIIGSGQTYFLRLTLPESLVTQISGPVRVQLGVVDRAIAGPRPPRDVLSVSWTGTLDQAGAFGRTLMSRRRPEEARTPARDVEGRVTLGAAPLLYLLVAAIALLVGGLLGFGAARVTIARR